MRSHSRALFAVAALAAFLALVPFAQAAPKNVVETIGHRGNDAGGFTFAMGIGLNQETGDVYVSDGDCCSFASGGHRVLQFSADGEFVRAWGWGVATGAAQFEICTTTCQRAVRGSGDGQFSLGLDPTSPQVAVDQSDGSVYVVDNLNNRVQKFSPTGAFLAKFGSEGSADGQFDYPTGIAVDPVSGDVYVADSNNNRIQRFDSSGSFKSQVGEPGFDPGQLSNPTHLAVDSTGRLYVVDQGNGRMQRFTDTGAFDQIVAEGLVNSPIDVTVDPATDHVYVAGFNADFSVKGIIEFDSAGVEVDIHAANAELGERFPTGMAVRSSSGRIYASSLNPSAVMVLDHVNAPSATIDPITTFDSDSATLSGEVNPNGIVDANWHFQISVDGGSTWEDIGTSGVVSEGTTAEAVGTEATHLEPNTEYQVRLLASKPFLAEQSIDSTSFTTATAVPRVYALDPGPVSAATAWLGANVNPRNAVTTYYIEYSTDLAFSTATSVPASEDSSAGSGGSPLFVNTQAKGLQPNTTYHYRVVATNVAGQTLGESRSFSTAAPEGPRAPGLPNGRVWEKVSPADKGGANVNAGSVWKIANGATVSQAAVGGDAVAYGSDGKFGGEAHEAEGGPAVSQYLARRGPDGWSTEGISPRSEVNPGDNHANAYRWFSPDLGKGLVTTFAGFNPGDPSDIANHYMRDNDTGAYRTISNADQSTAEGTGFTFEGASADGGRVFFETPVTGLPLERTPEGDVRPVAILPDGTPAVEGAQVGTSVDQRALEYNPISADGSRVFFSARFGLSSDAAIYRREDGTGTTMLVSASERTGDPSIPRAGDFWAASTDGSVAFLFGEGLTDDSVAAGEFGGGDLYRWDSNSPEDEQLTNLTATEQPEPKKFRGVTAVSDDGSSVYFVASGDLIGDGDRIPPSLYLWREGEGVRLVARGAGDEGLWGRELETKGEREPERVRASRVTPDGRYLAFASTETLTGYDTDGQSALYIYDSETERTVCASCGTVEAKAKGHAWFQSCMGKGPDTAGGNCEPSRFHASQNLSPDGSRLVFDSEDALVPEDTNGKIDVYEWQEGKIHLLSSGTSAFPSQLLDASEDGDDVFFTTAQQLVRSDEDDLIDLYDARVGGVEEPPVDLPCVADECQGTPTPPASFQTPSSSGFQGAGNSSLARPRCRKGKVRRKGRCVARTTRKGQAKKSQGANDNRRAGR